MGMVKTRHGGGDDDDAAEQIDADLSVVSRTRRSDSLRTKEPLTNVSF